jgi:hypothetical protein
MDLSSANKRFLLLPAGQKKFLKELDAVVKDKYEQQLLKFFDLAGWLQRTVEKKTPVRVK